MISGSVISAPAYRDDDLQPIAVLNEGFLVKASGHDLAVLLHGDLFAGEFEPRKKRGHVERPIERMGRAVDGNPDHPRILSRESRFSTCRRIRGSSPA